jgi:hypothetical protein
LIYFPDCNCSEGKKKGHRDREPSKAFSISAEVGRGLFLNNVYIDITIPGVQNPHCEPWDLAILSCVKTKKKDSRINILP